MVNKKIREGRFPANLLVSDDVLNDGIITKSNIGEPNLEKSKTNLYGWSKGGIIKSGKHYGDSGSYSRYFDLDKWYDEMVNEEESK